MKIIKVGRSRVNDIVIQHDPYVGRTHCQFIMDDNGGFCVVDLNSKNGTFINGVRRSGETQLKTNDTVRIGNSMLPWQSYFPPDGGGTPPPPPPPPPEKPGNFLVWSILGTIFCCLPMGIVSIVYATKVDNLWNVGKYVEAIDAARKAKTWFWLSFGFGLAVNLAWIIYYLVIILG